MDHVELTMERWSTDNQTEEQAPEDLLKECQEQQQKKVKGLQKDVPAEAQEAQEEGPKTSFEGEVIVVEEEVKRPQGQAAEPQEVQEARPQEEWEKEQEEQGQQEEMWVLHKEVAAEPPETREAGLQTPQEEPQEEHWEEDEGELLWEEERLWEEEAPQWEEGELLCGEEALQWEEEDLLWGEEEPLWGEEDEEELWWMHEDEEEPQWEEEEEEEEEGGGEAQRPYKEMGAEQHEVTMAPRPQQEYAAKDMQQGGAEVNRYIAEFFKDAMEQGAQAVVREPDGRLRMVFRDQYGQERYEVEAIESHKTTGKSHRHAVSGGMEAGAHRDMECVEGCVYGSLQACVHSDCDPEG